MPKSIDQPYYCIIKTYKFGEYKLIMRNGTNRTIVESELRNEGFRVFIALSKKSLIKLQNKPKARWFVDNPCWSIKAYDFITSINVDHS